MVRHREIKAEKADDRADQTLSLAQRETKYCPERQRCQNGQRRIPGLAAPAGPWFGVPGGNRRLAEPHRQIAALTQTRFVGWPIGQPTLLLRMWWRHLALALKGTASIQVLE